MTIGSYTRSFGLVAVLLTTSPCQAMVTDQTSCQEITGIVQRKSPEEIADLTSYGRIELMQFDAVHTDVGEPGFISVLPDDSIRGLIVAAAVSCGAHAKEAYKDSLAQFYMAVRAYVMMPKPSR